MQRSLVLAAMSVLGGLYTALVPRTRRSSDSDSGGVAAAAVENGERLRNGERQRQLSKRMGCFSSGRAHGALVANGIAKRQVARAAAVQKFAASGEQDIARIAFSHFARGRNSSVARNVCFACKL